MRDPSRADPFEHWAALQDASTDASNRLDETVDLAFWEQIAEHYDGDALPTRVPVVLERVGQLVPCDASLLELGAGTGAFACALAATVSRVTALDYSPAMQRVLQRNAALRGLDNVRAVLGRLEDSEFAQHDVVLAANALYRVHDLRKALTRIVRTARRRGIIVWSVGRQDAPQQLVRESVHSGRYRPGPDYVHVVDGLFALDVFANVEMIEVDDTQYFGSDAAAVAGLLSWQPITPSEHARAASLLPGLLEPNGSGWIWRRKGRIAIIWWDRPMLDETATARPGS